MNSKLLVLSDLFWENHLKRLTDYDIESFSLDKLDNPRYFCIKKYASIIISEKADLVLFAGDVTGDGSCGRGYGRAFYLLLLTLEYLKVPSLSISGNHDLDKHYHPIKEQIEGLTYAQECSDTVVNFRGLHILGISYATASKKKSLKKLLSLHSGSVDIVLAHSPLKRRTWLFDAGAQVVVTGHFDQKLSSVGDSVFISLNNNWMDNFTYATIKYNTENTVKWAEYNYLIRGSHSRIRESYNNLIENKVKASYHIDGMKEAVVDDNLRLGGPSSIDLADFRGIHFQYGVEKLIETKAKGEKLTHKEYQLLTSLYVHSDFKFSPTMIEDYLD